MARRPEPWRDAAWQAAVDAVVCGAQEDLWSPAGQAAREWLLARGLAPTTIRRFRLGFLPVDTRTAAVTGIPGGIWCARGITLPWAAPGSTYATDEDGDRPRWCGVNVRRLAPDVNVPWSGAGKLMCFKGSSRGYLYPFADFGPSPGHDVPILLVEGEIDALIAWQEVGWAAHTGTVGSASVRHLRPETRGALDQSPGLLIALDHDEAGIRAAHALR